MGNGAQLPPSRACTVSLSFASHPNFGLGWPLWIVKPLFNSWAFNPCWPIMFALPIELFFSVIPTCLFLPLPCGFTFLKCPLLLYLALFFIQPIQILFPAQSLPWLLQVSLTSFSSKSFQNLQNCSSGSHQTLHLTRLYLIMECVAL